MTRQACRLMIKGTVQGFGIRPWLARLAHELHLTGWVRNRSGDVEVWLEGDLEQLTQYRHRVYQKAPPGAAMEAVEATPQIPAGYARFEIKPCEEDTSLAVRVPRDRAMCAVCAEEITDPTNRRYGYPFTTCAACGPRYSILQALPHERKRTTLDRFLPCAACEREYATPTDRRFHVEGITCPACGPHVELWEPDGSLIAAHTDALEKCIDILQSGAIVAWKGVGGYQFVTRADRSDCVQRLRDVKGRPTKPFAIMVTEFTHGTAQEQRLWASPENPIVLMDSPPERWGACSEVALGLHTTGVLAPTTPLHHQIASALSCPLVVTSGNRSEEPIAQDEHEALAALGSCVDAFLVHDRPIQHRIDDSVLRVFSGAPSVLRLARGFAPCPLPELERIASGPPILAVGGHQKAAIALWTGHQAVLGPHIGDLDSAMSRDAFENCIRQLTALYQCRPTSIVCDLHPEYARTVWALGAGLPILQVQHHHAHAAAVMAEHGLLDGQVIALTWDGTGYGTDGTIWGGETLIATARDFRRMARLRPFPLIGGEAAIRHPHRIAFGLFACSQGSAATLTNTRLLDHLGISLQDAQVFAHMLDKNLNIHWTSSMGRLIDGLACLILPDIASTYEGEPAVRLESIANDATDTPLCITPQQCDKKLLLEGDWEPLLLGIWHGIGDGAHAAELSAQCHQAIVNWGIYTTQLAPDLPVVLGGGCFQNRHLHAGITSKLREAGRTVLAPRAIPPGDGGLAVGQLAVALAQRVSQERG